MNSEKKTDQTFQVAVFGSGCFWCTEAVFKMLKGVQSVAPGYAGGDASTAHYMRVSEGDTEHAECIKLVYDPAIISYTDLLTVFFASHDFTQVDGQGADHGRQYRSVIFYTTDAQRAEAARVVEEVRVESTKPIATEIVPLEHFFEAEDYHHDYYTQNKNAPYCQVVIAPKLEKIEKRFADLLAESAR
jgi:peptide-methionine (S)-S-oxide reductase